MKLMNEKLNELQAQVESLTAKADQVESLLLRVAELEKENGELNTQLTAFNDNPNVITDLQAKVTELEKENGELKTQNTEFVAQVDQLKKDIVDTSTVVEERASEIAVSLVAGAAVEPVQVIDSDKSKQNSEVGGRTLVNRW